MSEAQRRPRGNGLEDIRQDTNHFDDVVKMGRTELGEKRSS